MPFQIVRNDITNMAVDAIVNTANPRPIIGLGVDSAIHEKAGPRLLEARKMIGIINMGCAAITPAFDLKAKFVIHTVGPVWNGNSYGEETLLRSCYDNSLKLALEYGCQSIAFPMISTGNYGFPKDKALQIAIAAFSEFLMEHELQIYLVVFDRTSYKLSEMLFQHVASYIDQNYVNHRFLETYATAELCNSPRSICDCENAMPCSSKATSLEEILRQKDAGFTETLLQLINNTGKKDSYIYKKANLSKQHFSKIRNNPDYNPTKATAIALALALELDLDATNDFIGRAGYTLTNSSKFDLIIRYFIEHGEFNIVEINTALYEFDQPLLGA